MTMRFTTKTDFRPWNQVIQAMQAIIHKKDVSLKPISNSTIYE